MAYSDLFLCSKGNKFEPEIDMDEVDGDKLEEEQRRLDARAALIAKQAFIKRQAAIERAKKEAEEKKKREEEQRRLLLETLEEEYRQAAQKAREDKEAAERHEAWEKGGAPAEAEVRRKQANLAVLREAEEEKRKKEEEERKRKEEEDRRIQDDAERKQREEEEARLQALEEEALHRAAEEERNTIDPLTKAEMELEKILTAVSAQQADFRRYSDVANQVLASRAIAARKNVKALGGRGTPTHGRATPTGLGRTSPVPGNGAASPQDAHALHKRTAMIFVLPPSLGAFNFQAPGRRLLLMRTIKHIDLWQTGFEMPSVVLCLFNDIGFLATKVDDGVFQLLHRPADRFNITAATAPEVYGSRVFKARMVEGRKKEREKGERSRWCLRWQDWEFCIFHDGVT